LATWFLNAVKDFLDNHRILLDLKPADQDQTDRLLKDGVVIGCVSSKDKLIQGCRMDFLGCMEYRMMAAPEYLAKWYPSGANFENVSLAPLFIFDRKDELHLLFFKEAFGKIPSELSAHYLPSSEQFLKFILAGLGCGMLPEQQSKDYMNSGDLVELVPGCVAKVDLYWHCWNLKSKILQEFSENLVDKARKTLQK
jgi:LysR family transcriptional regulator (chromosome initiation inhibitor)